MFPHAEQNNIQTQTHTIKQCQNHRQCAQRLQISLRIHQKEWVPGIISHPGRRRRLKHSAPTAILPRQELTIRHAKQVLYMNLAKVSPWENTTKTN